MKNLIVTTYIIYLPVAILLTLVVAIIFFKNSKVFMLDIFNGREEIAFSTNKLFETGFYLLSLGFALFRMKINKDTFTVHEETRTSTGEYINEYIVNFGQQEMFEVLSNKVGMLAVVLGFIVFFLMFMLFRGKKKSAEGKARRQLMNLGKENS